YRLPRPEVKQPWGRALVGKGGGCSKIATTANWWRLMHLFGCDGVLARIYILQYSQMAALMTYSEEKRWPEIKLIGKIRLGSRTENLLRRKKTKFIAPPVLSFSGWTMTFCLSTGGRVVGTGTVLSQIKEDGLGHEDACASRTCSITNNKQAATELKCTAMLWAIYKLQATCVG
ncbi:unnamed protein product, partial [Discosporangium mesarthrocarpum]